MAAYMLFLRENAVFDPVAMAAYSAANRANADLFKQHYAIKPLAANGALDAFEGDLPDALVLLEFPSVAAARAWYDSPEYQAAIALRQKGATYRAILIEGSPVV
jgi:uncharacterized protein (DUF1330 family)